MDRESYPLPPQQELSPGEFECIAHSDRVDILSTSSLVVSPSDPILSSSSLSFPPSLLEESSIDVGQAMITSKLEPTVEGSGITSFETRSSIVQAVGTAGMFSPSSISSPPGKYWNSTVPTINESTDFSSTYGPSTPCATSCEVVSTFTTVITTTRILPRL
jgi:hypothetical protein